MARHGRCSKEWRAPCKLAHQLTSSSALTEQSVARYPRDQLGAWSPKGIWSEMVSFLRLLPCEQTKATLRPCLPLCRLTGRTRR
jgi:hypothetical protein